MSPSCLEFYVCHLIQSSLALVVLSFFYYGSPLIIFFLENSPACFVKIIRGRLYMHGSCGAAKVSKHGA